MRERTLFCHLGKTIFTTTPLELVLVKKLQRSKQISTNIYFLFNDCVELDAMGKNIDKQNPLEYHRMKHYFGY